jgi:hypothetical protein
MRVTMMIIGFDQDQYTRDRLNSGLSSIESVSTSCVCSTANRLTVVILGIFNRPERSNVVYHYIQKNIFEKADMNELFPNGSRITNGALKAFVINEVPETSPFSSRTASVDDHDRNHFNSDVSITRCPRLLFS